MSENAACLALLSLSTDQTEDKVPPSLNHNTDATDSVCSTDTAKTNTSDNTQQSLWKIRFDELRRYASEHGDCLVPARYPPNKKLGHWVMTQRRQYALMMEGKPSQLTDERIDELDKVGFAWKLRESSDSIWTCRLEELSKFKAKFGHCHVPKRYHPNPSLGRWVCNQRRNLKLALLRKPSSLTEERIAALKKIGFETALKHPHTHKAASTQDHQVEKIHSQAASFSTGASSSSSVDNLSDTKAEKQEPQANVDIPPCASVATVQTQSNAILSQGTAVPISAARPLPIQGIPLCSVHGVNVNISGGLVTETGFRMKESVLLTIKEKFLADKPWVCDICGSMHIGSYLDRSVHESRCAKRVLQAFNERRL